MKTLRKTFSKLMSYVFIYYNLLEQSRAMNSLVPFVRRQ